MHADLIPPVSSDWLEGLADDNPELVPPTVEWEHGVPVPRRPLSVIHVGPFFRRGGAENWLLDLVRHADPRYLRFTRCICTHPTAVDVRYVSELAGAGVVLEAGQTDSIREAARECDVLMYWGFGLDAELEGVRPPLAVQVIHGIANCQRHWVVGSRTTAAHAVAVSESVRARIAPDIPATVIYNGVDLRRLAARNGAQAMRRQLGLEPHDFAVGYVGRFSGEKRVAVLVDAVARLPDRYKLVLAGWGPLYPQLKAYAGHRLPGRHVIVRAGEELGDLYRAMDCVCLVSQQEGFPLVMVEAMLCQRPFLGAAVGGIPEIIRDRVNGVLTDGTETHLTRCLHELGENPRWAAGLAAEGAATAERFGHARRMARDYEVLLHQLWRGHTKVGM